MIHGLKNIDTIDKPKFPEVWEKLKHKIGGRKLVFHNAGFDISCLQETMKFYSMEKTDFDYVCTHEMVKQKLRLASNSLGITFSKRHDAERDAVACAQIFLKLSRN
jgi:DNA polymerase-3 subunit epsilon